MQLSEFGLANAEVYTLEIFKLKVQLVYCKEACDYCDAFTAHLARLQHQLLCCLFIRALISCTLLA